MYFNNNLLKYKQLLISLVLLMFSCFNTAIHAQTYQMTIENGKKVSPTEFEFDIYIKSTGSNFTISSYQFAIPFNENIANGGDLDFVYINGTSDFISAVPSVAFGINQND